LRQAPNLIPILSKQRRYFIYLVTNHFPRCNFGCGSAAL
jgi:hypothetical protein